MRILRPGKWCKEVECPKCGALLLVEEGDLRAASGGFVATCCFPVCPGRACGEDVVIPSSFVSSEVIDRVMARGRR